VIGQSATGRGNLGRLTTSTRRLRLVVASEHENDAIVRRVTEQAKQCVLAVGHETEAQPELEETTPELATVLCTADPYAIALEQAMHRIA
jgi:hypothetical protein